MATDVRPICSLLGMLCDREVVVLEQRIRFCGEWEGVRRDGDEGGEGEKVVCER